MYFSPRRREPKVPVRHLALLLAVLFPASIALAQTGVVAGTIIDAATRRPLNGVRVLVVGDQNLAASSDDRGRYAIRLVPAGQHSLRASRIGMAPISQSFSVRGGDTTRVDLQLNETSVELSQVVVTGTGGAVEKRQVSARWDRPSPRWMRPRSPTRRP
jgi:hypothetical protein